jgi:protocatechuate 3,4-dioxygenase beta subunit
MYLPSGERLKKIAAWVEGHSRPEPTAALPKPKATRQLPGASLRYDTACEKTSSWMWGMMDANDDMHIGRLLTRREAATLLAISGIALVSRTAHGLLQSLETKTLPLSCVVRPAQTEGPYFVDEHLNRADIRTDPTTGKVTAGAPLELLMTLSSVGSGGCLPLAGARVDIWHCDASGVYSDIDDPVFNTVGRKFLRGYQVTDTNGTVRFDTIYPGWYPIRTVHIHFKVRTNAGSARGHEFTSQLYFNDRFTDRAFTRAEYAGRGPRTVRNRQDEIFRNGGDQLLLDVKEKGDGYAAIFSLGLQSA